MTAGDGRSWVSNPVQAVLDWCAHSGVTWTRSRCFLFNEVIVAADPSGRGRAAPPRVVAAAAHCGPSRPGEGSRRLWCLPAVVRRGRSSLPITFNQTTIFKQNARLCSLAPAFCLVLWAHSLAAAPGRARLSLRRASVPPTKPTLHAPPTTTPSTRVPARHKQSNVLQQLGVLPSVPPSASMARSEHHHAPLVAPARKCHHAPPRHAECAWLPARSGRARPRQG